MFGDTRLGADYRALHTGLAKFSRRRARFFVVLGHEVAAERRMSFGHDIIFTYGPFAAIESRMYHPALRWSILGGAILLAAGFSATLCSVAAAIAFIPVALCFSLAPSAAMRRRWAIPVPMASQKKQLYSY